MLAGRTLYQDFWDNKPPMIFFFNAAAMKIGGYSVNSIRIMERILAGSGIILFYFAVLAYFRSYWLAWCGTALFLINLYNPLSLEEGNFTEEYGAIFVLIGISAVLLSTRHVYRITYRWMIVSGCFFACAMLFKEPFLLSSLPWFLFLLLRTDRFSWRDVSKRAVFCLVGVLIPFMVSLIYLGMHHALSDYLDVISYNFSNNETPSPLTDRLLDNIQFARLKMLNQFTVMQWLALLSLGLFASSSLRKKYGTLLLTTLAAFLADFTGTALSPRHYGHYYLQLAPSFSLLAMFGFVVLREIVQQLRLSRLICIAIAVLCIAWFDLPATRALIDRLAQPNQWAQPSRFAEALKKMAKPGDTLWGVSLNYTEIYMETGLLSPSRYHMFFNHLFIDTKNSTGQEKFDSVTRMLQTEPPTFILVELQKDTTLLFESGIFEWIQSEYASTGYGNENTEIFIKKERLADHTLP